MEHNGGLGYEVQTNIRCCANCKFGGYIGSVSSVSMRMCICERDGEVQNSQYFEVAVEPLGKCNQYKPNLKTKHKGD